LLDAAQRDILLPNSHWRRRQVLLLSGDDVMKVLDMAEGMEVVERAFVELASGTAIMPPRINLSGLQGGDQLRQ
jgi:ornithine cyclodeaminase/alanine dehydrogenase-like protein (mu-crystallin family)